MADTPESSEHVDNEETSVAEEGTNLVDTIDDPALDWVDAEPQGIASTFCHPGRQAYTVVEYGGEHEGFQRKFKIMRPTPDARICSEFTQDAFPMYKVVFKDLGL